MKTIHLCSKPEFALLNRYDQPGDFTDCYTTTIDHPVSHQQFVEAFYTTWLFKLERFILRWLVAKPSTDFQAKQLAEGKIDFFAAWKLEERADNQLLMCDYQNKTRSFLMVTPLRIEQSAEQNATQLYFGSAIVASAKSNSGEPTLSIFFKCLLGFHKLYSKALLAAAKKRLSRSNSVIVG